jgi:hypothetical protein
MAKHVFFKMNMFHPDALVILGWLSFTVGACVMQPTWLKLVLLSAARVLP